MSNQNDVETIANAVVSSPQFSALITASMGAAMQSMLYIYKLSLHGEIIFL